MTRRLYFGDVNNVTPTWYDVSFWVPGLAKLDEKVHAYGQGAQLDFDLWAEREGLPIPILPKSGMEVLYYDHNAGNPLLHKYLVGGRISADFPQPVPEDKHYRIEVDGFEEDFTLIIPYTIFYQSAYGTDSSRITALIQEAVASFGLKGTWDASNFVSGPFITYKVGSYNDYNLKSIAYILADIGMDPGQPTDALYKVPSRRYFVSCQWADPTNPGVGGAGALVRVLNYYSGSQAIQEPVPLTDRPDGKAYYAYDTFPRAATSTALGKSETGQDWAALLGTWGINANKAYLASHTSGEDAVVLASTVSDGEVQATFSTVAGNQRLLFRVVSLPVPAYKWEGWVLENNAGASYRLRKYQAGAFTDVATYLVTPANGDVIKVVLSGNTITVYINSVAQTPVTDAFNQTANLHGIGQSNTSVARFDNFSVWGRGARFYKLRVGNDRTPMINIVTIAGPGSDPAPVSWDNHTGTTGANDGDLTKTALTDAWDAGASGKEAIAEDGASVTATAEQVRKVQDGFDRADNTALLGTAPSGQAWLLLGTNAVAGILSNKGYFVSGTGPLYAYIDSGVATCISEVKLATVATGARLLFRMTDASNLWFLEAQASSYKIIKRVAGVETVMGTHSVTPASGDVVKVSCEDNVIKFYLNGAGPFITVTDAFNQTATKHGWGTASALTPRFDDFSVWTTYADMAFGIGATTTITHYNQIAFGWKINAAARTAQPVEAGVLVGSAVAYVLGDRFKVAIRPVVSGGGIVGYQVRYYKNDVQQFLSTQNPSPSAGTPFHAQGAIFHKGATISNVTIKLFSYSIFTNDVSIGKWGPKAHKTLIKRDDLDTREKRQALGDAILQRHPDPYQTIDLDTLQEYGEGHIVLLNSQKMGWQNYRQVVASMLRKLKPQDRVLYHLQVGEADIEWLDDDPLGYMLQSQIEDRTEPAPPVNLGQSQGVPDGPNTVTHNFTWDKPKGDERWIYFLFSPIGGPIFERRLPAQSGAGAVNDLPPSTPYRVRACYEDWNRNRSGYTTAIDIVTAGAAQLPQPTWLVPYTTGTDRRGGWIRASINPVAGASQYDYYYRFSPTGPSFHVPNTPTGDTFCTVPGLPVPCSLLLTAVAVDAYGRHGLESADKSVSIGGVPSRDFPEEGWDASNPDEVLAGWLPLSPSVLADFTIDATVASMNGKSSLKMSVPASATKKIISPQIECFPGEVIDHTFAVKRGSGAGTAPTASGFVRYFAQDGTTQIGSDTLIAAAFTPTTSFPTKPVEGRLTVPAGAYSFSYVFQGVGAGGATTYNLWWAYPKIKREVGNKQLAAGAVTPDKTLFKASITDPIILYDENGDAVLWLYWSPGAHRWVFGPVAGNPTYSDQGWEFQDAGGNPFALQNGALTYSGKTFLGGATTPTAILQLLAGTATANTAPLKFTSGTNLTTPEAGAVEYNGSNLELTPVVDRHNVQLASPPITSSTTVGNTGTETTVFTGSISANELKVGRTLVLKFWAHYANGLGRTETGTLKVKMNGVLVLSAITLPSPGSGAKPIYIEYWATQRTAGAGGTHRDALHSRINSVVADQVATTDGGLDTTVAQDITVTFQWSAAGAGNLFSANIAHVEFI
jgi:hypothetical protein